MQPPKADFIREAIAREAAVLRKTDPAYFLERLGAVVPSTFCPPGDAVPWLLSEAHGDADDHRAIDAAVALIYRRFPLMFCP